MIKDALAGRMKSDTVWHGVPVDHSAEYAEQMRSEMKDEQGRWVKVTSNAQNHYWDAECLALVVASLKRIINIDRGVDEAVR